MTTSLDRLDGALADWIAESTGFVCAVVDVGDEKMLARLRQGSLGIEPSFIPIRLPVAMLPAEVMPALLPLAEKDWALRQWTVRMALDDAVNGVAPSLCGWLRSTAPIADVARAFQASLVRVSPEGRRYVFRHHDPRVRSCLNALLGPKWLAGLLPLTHEWLHLSPYGQQQEISPARDSAAAVSIPATREFQAILRCGDINQAIRLACKNGWVFETQAYRTADAALTRAEAYGFAGLADRLAYMLHALTVGAQFDAQPDIHAALQEAAVRQDTYVRAMGRLPKEVWTSAAITTQRR